MFVDDPSKGRFASPFAYALSAAIVIFAVAGAFVYAFSTIEYVFNWPSVWKYRFNLLRGFRMTIIISFFSLLLSLLLGTVVGVARNSRVIPFRQLARGYVEVVRGTPLLVQILIFFYVVANAFGVSNRYAVGVLIMALFSGAYVSEIIRAGLESIPESQLESARSLGLTRYQIYRYVVLPQMITRILPPLTGQFASLIKDSSLLSIIAVNEFTQMAREVNANTFSTLESYVPLAFGYLILTLPISLFTQRLERRFSYED